MSRHSLLYRAARIGGVVLVTLSVQVAGMAGQAPRPPVTALQPCPPPNEQPSGAMCGSVSVLEARAQKGGRQIALNVVVLPSRTAAGHADPIVAIGGAPGAAATRLAGAYPRLYDALQNDHDIVLVDQRGTGGSHPLDCETIDLTKDGLAVPIVDDIATVSLDLWAHERGYERLRPNLLRL